MASIAEIRQQYPQYNDMSDEQLADAMHRKFYSDMPRDQFNSKIGISQQQAQQQPSSVGPVEKALEPLTSYPGVYDQMQRDSRSMMSEGIEQAGRGGIYDTAVGVGKTALGGLGYLTSPINAALRTVVGNPLEENTGIPKEWSELAAGMALPIPGRIPMPSKTAPKAVPTIAELKDSYRTAKSSPEVADVQIKPSSMSREADIVGTKLNADWLDPELAPKTFHILKKLNNPDGSTVTMANVDSARRLLGQIAGRGDEDAAAAMIVKKQLDEWLPNVSRSDTLAGDPAAAYSIMKSGREDYAAAKLAEGLDKKIANAELSTAGANSGLNLQNRLRQNVHQFLKSDDSRGLSASERQIFEQFIRGSKSENVLRYVGNFFGGGGGIGAGAWSAGGVMAAGPVGMAMPLGGLGLNRLSAAITSSKADKLSEMIRSRSPLGQRMQGQVEDWSKAAEAAEISPTARNISRLTIASRNLSHNLKDAGISVSPNDLLRSLMGPSGGKAEDQEP
jgi:hypothetical protein